MRNLLKSGIAAGLLILSSSTAFAGTTPEVSNIAFAASSVNVSQSSGYFEIQVSVSSSAAVRNQPTTVFLRPLVNDAPDLTLSSLHGRLNVISSTTTETRFSGKIIVPQQFTPGRYGVVLSNAFADVAGNKNQVDFSRSWPTAEILNTGGPLPAGVISTIPLGVFPEDYLPTSYVAIWNRAKQQLTENIALAKSAEVDYPDNAFIFVNILSTVPEVPKLAGDASADIRTINSFTTDVKNFFESVQTAVNTIKVQNLKNKPKTGPISPNIPTKKPLVMHPTTISCVKGKVIKKVTGVNPQCPSGYKKK